MTWVVIFDGEIVAMFTLERDARGFAQARFKGDATVLNGQSQRELVLAAIHDGAMDAEEVAALIGMSRQQVSAYLSSLRRDGLVTACGTRRLGARGPHATLYKAKPAVDMVGA